MREVFRLVGKIALDGTVKLDEELKAIDKQAGKVGASLNKMGKDLTKIGMELTKNVTVPIAAAAVAIYKGVELASDLAETVSKTGEIFGGNAKQIEDWASTADKSFGQSKQQAMDAADGFAMYGKSAGLTGEALVKFGQQHTELASDMASFFNTSPEEAITAIGAAFRGEMEPIRKYNVLLDDASLRQQALEMGIVKTTKDALTPQQKVLAASALIMQQTTAAQGDFIRTSDGLANQQRILKAEITNMATELGGAFLPIAKEVVTVLRENFLPVLKGVTDWFNKLSPGMKNTIVSLALLAAAIGPVLMLAGKFDTLLGVLIPLIAKLVTGQLTLNAVMAANPFLLVVTAIGALVAIGIVLYNNWDTIKNFAIKAWGTITIAVENAISYMKILLFQYLKMWVDTANVVGKYIPGLNKVLANTQKTLTDWTNAEKEAIKSRNESKNATEKHTESIKQNNKAVQEHVTTTKKATAEEIAAAKKLAEERAAFEKDWSNKLFQETATRKAILDKEESDAIAQAQKIGADITNIKDYYKAKREQLEKDEAEKRLQMENDFNQKYQSNQITSLEAIFNNDKASYNQRYQALQELTALKLTALDQDYQASLAKAQAEGVDTTNLTALYAQQRAQIIQTEAEQEKAMRQQTYDFWVSSLQGIIGQLGSIYSQYYENRMIELDNWYQKQKAEIDNSTLSEEEKQAKLSALDEEMTRKKKEEGRKRAKQEKDFAIFEAIINTANAVVKTLASTFWPLNMIMAAVIGAMGLAQVSAIQSKPLPALAEGGKATKPTFAMIGEGKYNEAVLPLSKQVFSEIGQGVAENSGGIGGYKTANIYLSIDGKTLAKALGKPLTDQIQLITGLRA